MAGKTVYRLVVYLVEMKVAWTVAVKAVRRVHLVCWSVDYSVEQMVEKMENMMVDMMV